MRQLLGRGLLERRDVQALRVHQPGDVGDHAALARGVHPLQHEQHRARAPRPRPRRTAPPAGLEPLGERGHRRGGRPSCPRPDRGRARVERGRSRSRGARSACRTSGASVAGSRSRRGPVAPGMLEWRACSDCGHRPAARRRRRRRARRALRLARGRAEPYVRVNFVSSVDGAVTVDGQSGGLGTRPTRRCSGCSASCADVVLVGAGTVRAEKYRGRAAAHARGAGPRRRSRWSPARRTSTPTSRLFTDTAVPPLVLTWGRRPAGRSGRRWPRRAARSSCSPRLYPGRPARRAGRPGAAPGAVRGRAVAARRAARGGRGGRAVPHRRPRCWRAATRAGSRTARR